MGAQLIGHAVMTDQAGMAPTRYGFLGFFDALRAMGRGIWSEHARARQLFKRGLAKKFKDSKLGVLWDLFDPVFMAVAFIAVRSLRGFDTASGELPFVIYCVIGLMLWQNFMDGLNTALRVIKNHEQFLSAIKIKPEALVLTALYEAGFRTLIRLAVCLIAPFILTGLGLLDAQFMPNLPGAVLFMAASPILLIMGLGLGFLLSPFATISSDILRFVPLMARPLMFLSLAIFALPAKYAMYNPVGIWVDSQRSMLLGLPVELAADLLWSGLLAGGVFLIGWYVLHAALPAVADPE